MDATARVATEEVVHSADAQLAGVVVRSVDLVTHNRDTNV
jgi:hypothetical protein